jgi:hypothetical protein
MLRLIGESVVITAAILLLSGVMYFTFTNLPWDYVIAGIAFSTGVTVGKRRARRQSTS